MCVRQIEVESTSADGTCTRNVALAVDSEGVVTVPGDLVVGAAGTTLTRMHAELEEIRATLERVNLTAHAAHRQVSVCVCGGCGCGVWVRAFL